MEDSHPTDGNPPGAFDRFATGGLELLGVEADEIELGVMRLVDSIYRPHIDALMEPDLDGVEPEPSPDLSRAPEGA